MDSKKDVLLGLLKWSDAFVQLDARVPGVVLPEWLLHDRGVVLQLGYGMAVPIPDLVVDDEGISATLSFRRTPFACRLPWRAVYVISDGRERRAVYPEDMPPDLLAPPEESEPPPPLPEPKKKPRPNHLKLVK